MSWKGFWKRTVFFRRNPDIYAHYQDIRGYNAATPAQREDMLRQIKAYAIAHTDFYSGYTPDSVFPVMTKLDYLDHYDAIKSREAFAEPLHKSSTSGSTGVPFTVIQDRNKRLRTIADLKVFGDYALYPSHERMLQLRVYHGKELDRSVDRRENIWRYDISFLDDAHLEELVRFMNRLKPRIIFGYASSMENICDYMERTGAKPSFRCRSVLVGAEMLTETTAEKISRVFRCPVFDRYSNMEMGIYSQREYGKTDFRINRASYYLEVLKLDADEPAAEGELGRIVFTDLYNHAFPMIRYDTGDLGSYVLINGEIHLREVLGRRADCIYSTKKELIGFHSISKRMWGIPNIRQWQFIQKSPTEYELVVCCTAQVDRQQVLDRLLPVLGEDAQLRIRCVDQIPVLNSQKRKYIINEMKS